MFYLFLEFEIRLFYARRQILAIRFKTRRFELFGKESLLKSLPEEIFGFASGRERSLQGSFEALPTETLCTEDSLPKLH